MESGTARFQESPSPTPYTTTPAHGIKVRLKSCLYKAKDTTDRFCYLQRSHAEMEVSHRSSISPLFEPLDEPPHLDSPPPHRSHLALPPLHPSIRSPTSREGIAPQGPQRGFDYRRPVMSVNTQSRPNEVVDLTNSDEEDEYGDIELDDSHPAFQAQQEPQANTRQRLPHFDHSIIDLSEDSSPAMQRQSQRARQTPEHSRRTPYLEGRRPPSLLRERSSDLTLMQVRQREDNRRERTRREQEGQERDRGTPSPPHRPPRFSLQQLAREEQADEPIDLTDDDVVFVSARPNPNRPRSTHRHRPDPTIEERLAARQARVERSRRHEAYEAGSSRLAAVLGNYFSLRESFTAPQLATAIPTALADFLPHFTHRSTGGTTRGFVPPGMMDYGTTAFSMGYEQPRREATPPAYVAPDPPEEGFTRSPAEDEAVVCPNCGDELAIGKDEEKRSVWVVKACGHVSFCPLQLHLMAGRTVADNNRSIAGHAWCIGQ